MPQVFFKIDDIKFDVAAGTSAMDAVEMAGATLPFACRHGSCGTCRCFINEGQQNLNAMTENEKLFFENAMSAEKHERLACQVIINGDVEIEA